MARRRGRSRKNGDREPNGRSQRLPDPGPEGVALHRAAEGSPELIAEYWQADETQRAKLRERYRAAGKCQRLEHPLGVCRELRLISEAEYLAGASYSQAHAAIERQRGEKSCLGAVVDGIGAPLIAIDSKAEADCEATYLRAREAIRSFGTRAYHLAQNTILYGRRPGFLDGASRKTPDGRRADKRDLDALRGALTALLRVYKHRSGADDTVSL